VVAKGRPRVAIARDCAFELGVQHGRHIAHCRTDTVRSTGHSSSYHTVRATKLTRVAHQANDGALAKLVSDQANESRQGGQCALTGKLHLDTILTRAHEPPQKNSEAALKDAVAGVTGAAASGRRPSNWLSDVRDVPNRDPLYRPVADVEHTRPNGVHIVCPGPRHDSFVNEQLDAQNKGKRPVSAPHDDLLS